MNNTLGRRRTRAAWVLRELLDRTQGEAVPEEIRNLIPQLAPPRSSVMNLVDVFNFQAESFIKGYYAGLEYSLHRYSRPDQLRSLCAWSPESPDEMWSWSTYQLPQAVALMTEGLGSPVEDPFSGPSISILDLQAAAFVAGFHCGNNKELLGLLQDQQGGPRPGHVNELAGVMSLKLRLPPPASGREAVGYGASYSPDGRFLAIGYDNGQVNIVDVAGSQTSGLIACHDGKCQSTVFTRDGKLLITSGADGMIRFWEMPSLLMTRELAGDATALAIDESGQFLVSAGFSILVWDLSALDHTPREVTPRPSEDFLTSAGIPWQMCATAQEGVIGLARDSAGLQLVDTQALSVVSYQNLHGGVYAVALSQLGSILAATGRDGRVSFYRTDNSQLQADAVFESPLSAANLVGRTVSFSSDGKVLAVAGWGGAVCLFDVLNPAWSVASLQYPGNVTSIAFSPTDPRILALTGVGGELWICSLERGSQ